MQNTHFSAIYNCFLNKITDDMYMELTPKDTVKDLQRLLINAIPGFEFPRVNLYEYTIDVKEIAEEEVSDSDFVIGETAEQPPRIIVDNSNFACELTSEEINILAILMMIGWVQRQITSIENTRMKYSGSDFKMTSQANHLLKLLSLLNEVHRQSHHMQRLYRRRKLTTTGYASNWSSIMETSTLGD